MYMQPLWMDGYSWMALVTIVSATLIWLALLGVGAWLFAAWVGRDAMRLDRAALRIERAQNDLLRARDTLNQALPLDTTATSGESAETATHPDSLKRL